MSALKSSQLLQAKLAKYKMNPQYPSFNQIKHDALVLKRDDQLWPKIDHNDSGDNISQLLWSCC